MKKKLRNHNTTKVQLFVSVIASLFLMSGPSSGSPAEVITNQPAPAVELLTQYPVDLSDTLGVQLTQISLTAEKMMVDVRYRITDPEKARSLLAEANRPILTHHASGKSFVVPVTAKVGPLRQTAQSPKLNKIYYLFFGNHGRTIKSGDKVTLRFGETIISNMTVL